MCIKEEEGGGEMAELACYWKCIILVSFQPTLCKECVIDSLRR